VLGHADGRIEMRDINTGEIERSRIDVAETDNLFSDIGD
jgi:ribose 5-phosphate isomerase A